MSLADSLEDQAASTELAKADQHVTVYDLIERQKPEIARALPTGMTPERFARIVVTAIKQTPALQTCSASSLLGAVMLSAQLGLEPGPLGHAYLVPFKNRRTGQTEVTFIVGYKGLIDLALRSGKIESIVARDVRENDTFSYELGTDEKIVHRPALGARGSTIAYYAVARLVGGGRIMHVMSREDIELHRTRSRAKDSGPWQTDYDAMARKTVIRAMSAYLPLSIDAARAIANDDVVTTNIDADLADRTPEPNLIDVDGEEISPDDTPDDDGPRGASGSPAPPSVHEDGNEDDGTASAPTGPVGEAHGPSSSPVETVNDDGARNIAMWCADVGIDDRLRPAFLWAFSNGRYKSAHDVGVDEQGALRHALRQISSGALTLVADPDGEKPSRLVAPGAAAPGDVVDDVAPPAAIAWREILGRTPGIGTARLLRKARDLANEHDLPLPTNVDEIDPSLTPELRAWLEERIAEAS